MGYQSLRTRTVFALQAWAFRLRILVAEAFTGLDTDPSLEPKNEGSQMHGSWIQEQLDAGSHAGTSGEELSRLARPLLLLLQQLL